MLFLRKRRLKNNNGTLEHYKNLSVSFSHGIYTENSITREISIGQVFSNFPVQTQILKEDFTDHYPILVESNISISRKQQKAVRRSLGQMERFDKKSLYVGAAIASPEFFVERKPH